MAVENRKYKFPIVTSDTDVVTKPKWSYKAVRMHMHKYM